MLPSVTWSSSVPQGASQIMPSRAKGTGEECEKGKGGWVGGAVLKVTSFFSV